MIQQEPYPMVRVSLCLGIWNTKLGNWFLLEKASESAPVLHNEIERGLECREHRPEGTVHCGELCKQTNVSSNVLSKPDDRLMRHSQCS